MANPAGGEKAAALASTSPDPTAMGSLEAAFLAVALSTCLTRSGVKLGLAWRIRAATPETTPAAMEVPLPRR